MNYKRKKMHSSQSCGLCKWGKRYNEPRKDRKFFIERQIEHETKELTQSSDMA